MIAPIKVIYLTSSPVKVSPYARPPFEVYFDASARGSWSHFMQNVLKMSYDSAFSKNKMYRGLFTTIPQSEKYYGKRYQRTLNAYILEL